MILKLVVTHFGTQIITKENKITTKHNSDGLIKCLRQRQDRFVTIPNIYALKLFTIYKILWHPD